MIEHSLAELATQHAGAVVLARPRVVLALPTTQCALYITRTLGHLWEELQPVADRYEPVLVVCLNGRDPDNAAERQIRSFAKDIRRTSSTRPQPEFELLVVDRIGKNHAINTLADRARELSAEVFHLVDDDVRFAPGSLRANVDALMSIDRDAVALVGSDYEAVRHPLRSLLGTSKSAFDAVSRWWWQNAFRIPFEPEAARSTFCSAQSLAMRLHHFPTLPEDATGVTDDAYINFWVAAHGGTVRKVPGSILYFEVASSYPEWLRQQTRTFLGTIRALERFPVQRLATEDAYAWPYAMNRGSRRPFVEPTLRRAWFAMVFRAARAHLTRRVERLRRLDLQVGWGRAETTKGILHAALRDVT